VACLLAHTLKMVWMGNYDIPALCSQSIRSTVELHPVKNQYPYTNPIVLQFSACDNWHNELHTY
jgi:hypothetical protein